MVERHSDPFVDGAKRCFGFPAHTMIHTAKRPACMTRLSLHFPLAFVATIATLVLMEPARTIINLLGGPNAVAFIAGVHRTRVSNWARPRASGGTGGSIPFKHVPALINAARGKGLELSAEDFLPSEQEKAV